MDYSNELIFLFKCVNPINHSGFNTKDWTALGVVVICVSIRM